MLILGLGPSQAAEFFVAQSATADDANSGDADHPCRTITAAAARARAGDTITVLAGDYRSQDSGWGPGVIPLRIAGQEARPIRLVAADGAQVLVGSLALKQCRFLRIEGFHFRNAQMTEIGMWPDMPEIVRDQTAASPAADNRRQSEAERRSQIKHVFRAYFERVKQLEYATALDLQDCFHVELRHNSIDGYWAGIQCRHCDAITIEDNQIGHCVNGIYTWQPSPALTRSVIRKNVISQSLDNGIDVREQSRQVRIEKNQVRYSGHSHISLQNGVQDCTVRHNEVWYGGYYSETMQYPGSSAISIHSSRSGIVVEGNLAAYQIDLTGIDGNGLIVDLMQDGAAVTIRDNRVWRNAGAGLNTTSSPQARIYHNAFVENGFKSEGRQGAGIYLSRDEDVQHTIVNNIFAHNRTGGIVGYHNLSKQRRIDHNLYFCPDGQPLIWDGWEVDERSYRSLEAVQQHTPWERHGIVADPRFRDIEQADFRLRSDSPAIGAAEAVPRAGQAGQAVPAQIGPRIPPTD